MFIIFGVVERANSRMWLHFSAVIEFLISVKKMNFYCVYLGRIVCLVVKAVGGSCWGVLLGQLAAEEILEIDQGRFA